MAHKLPATLILGRPSQDVPKLMNLFLISLLAKSLSILGRPQQRVQKIQGPFSNILSMGNDIGKEFMVEQPKSIMECTHEEGYIN